MVRLRAGTSIITNRRCQKRKIIWCVKDLLKSLWHCGFCKRKPKFLMIWLLAGIFVYNFLFWSSKVQDGRKIELTEIYHRVNRSYCRCGRSWRWVIRDEMDISQSALPSGQIGDSWCHVSPSDWSLHGQDSGVSPIDNLFASLLGGLKDDVTRSKMAALLGAVHCDVEWIFLTDEPSATIDFNVLDKIVNRKLETGLSYLKEDLYIRPEIRKPECEGRDDQSDLDLDKVKAERYSLRPVSLTNLVQIRSIRGVGGRKEASEISATWSPSVTIFPGTFTVIGSRNLLLHRDVFWMAIGWLLRGEGQSDSWLYLQRLLWETNQQITEFDVIYDFINSQPAPFSKKDTLSDWSRINETMAWLKGWKAQRTQSSFLACALELLDNDIKTKFSSIASQKHVFLTWFDALQKLHYKFPKRVAYLRLKQKSKLLGIPVYRAPTKIENDRKSDYNYALETIRAIKTVQNYSEAYDLDSKPKPKSKSKSKKFVVDSSAGKNNKNKFMQLLWRHGRRSTGISGYCDVVDVKLKDGLEQKPFVFLDVVLVVVFNFPFLVANIPMLLAMYGKHFRHIVFCGESVLAFQKLYNFKGYEPVTFVKSYHGRGAWGNGCVSSVIKMGYEVKGYLQMSDDVLLNVWNLQNLPLDRPWFQSRARVADIRLARVPDIATTNRWYPWTFVIGRYAAVQSMRRLYQLKSSSQMGPMVRRFLSQLSKNTGCKHCLMYEASDIFYIPNQLAHQYTVFSDFLEYNRLHLEIAIPTIIFGLSPEAEVVRLRGNYVWGYDRADFEIYYNSFDHFQHPWKLSRLSIREEMIFFCKEFLSRVYNVSDVSWEGI